MNDVEFAEFCTKHSEFSFEMSAEGDLVVTAPRDSLNGVRNSELVSQLRNWADEDNRGFVGGCSTGFVLSNGARRSPGASWTLKSRAAGLEGYWHLCPDFVIELRSQCDWIRTVRAKMDEYMANGAQLGWLIDVESRSVSIYRAGREVETLTGTDSVAGDGPVAGFVLDLLPVWNPLAR